MASFIILVLVGLLLLAIVPRGPKYIKQLPKTKSYFKIPSWRLK